MKALSDESLPAILFLVIVSIVVYFTRPIWHPFFMLFYTNPAITEALVISLVVVAAYKRFKSLKPANAEKRQSVGLTNLTVVVFLFLTLMVVLLPLQQFYTPLYLSKHLSYDRISQLPEIDPTVVRIVPKVVGDKYAMDALQFPRYTLSRGSIVFINRTPYWGYGLIPEGLVNSFILKDKGAIYVDMSAFGKRTEIKEQSFKVGVGMYVTDNYLWQIYSRKYTVDCGNPYFVPYKGTLYIAVPLIGYELHFRFPMWTPLTTFTEY